MDTNEKKKGSEKYVNNQVITNNNNQNVAFSELWSIKEY